MSLLFRGCGIFLTPLPKNGGGAMFFIVTNSQLNS